MNMVDLLLSLENNSKRLVLKVPSIPSIPSIITINTINITNNATYNTI